MNKIKERERGMKATIKETGEVVEVTYYDRYAYPDEGTDCENAIVFKADAIDGTLEDGTPVKLHTIQDSVETDRWIAVFTNESMSHALPVSA